MGEFHNRERPTAPGTRKPRSRDGFSGSAVYLPRADGFGRRGFGTLEPSPIGPDKFTEFWVGLKLGAFVTRKVF
jgi:hypothetical protein